PASAGAVGGGNSVCSAVNCQVKIRLVEERSQSKSPYFIAKSPLPAFRCGRAFAMAARSLHLFQRPVLMFPKPKPALVPNTYAYESEPMVKATGFREYDARWLFGKEINLMGVQALGMGLGALIAELGANQEIVTGHDFRGYSASIKYALISGLLASGCKVHDIGLAVTPMAYFAQFDLD